MKASRIGMIVAAGSLVTAIVTVVASLNWAAGSFRWHLVYLWVTGPYFLCALVLLIPWGMARRRVLSGCTTACGLLIFTYLFYVEGLVRSRSSTAPIIILFAPIYLTLGGAAFWALAYFVGPKLLRTSKASGASDGG